MSGPDAPPFEMWQNVRLHDGKDSLDLDEQTARRLVAGAIPPADAPPGYRGVVRLIDALIRPGSASELANELRAVAGIAAAASSPSPPARRSSMMRKVVSTKGIGVAAVVGGLSLFSGLAAAGALPGAAQQAASDALAKVGISVPSPNDHARDHPQAPGDSTDQPAGTPNGSDISNTARTTDSTGVDKGAEISTKASGGTSQAGDHGTTTTPSLPDQANQGKDHRP
jgi:hypothetical protein